jgi:hypothetical protein
MLNMLITDCKIRDMLQLDLYGYHLHTYLHTHGIEVLSSGTSLCLRFA